MNPARCDRDCAFRAGPSSQNTCDYLIIANQARGCPVGPDCARYKPAMGERKNRRESIKMPIKLEGEKLDKLRQAFDGGMSVNEAAKRVGVAVSTASRRFAAFRRRAEPGGAPSPVGADGPGGSLVAPTTAAAASRLSCLPEEDKPAETDPAPEAPGYDELLCRLSLLLSLVGPENSRSVNHNLRYAASGMVNDWFDGLAAPEEGQEKQ